MPDQPSWRLHSISHVSTGAARCGSFRGDPFDGQEILGAARLGHGRIPCAGARGYNRGRAGLDTTGGRRVQRAPAGGAPWRNDSQSSTGSSEQWTTPSLGRPSSLRPTSSTGRSSVDSLINACKRGVWVRVILDGYIVSSASKRLAEALNGDNRHEDGTYVQPGDNNSRGEENRPDLPPDPLSESELVDGWSRGGHGHAPHVGWRRSYVTKCDRAAAAAARGMHGKFYVFSRPGRPTTSSWSAPRTSTGAAPAGDGTTSTPITGSAETSAVPEVHREMTDENG